MNTHRFPVPLWRVALALVAVWFIVTVSAHAADAPRRERLPITTKSRQALRFFERATTEFENLHLTRAHATLRQAVKLDPNFALAHLMLAFRNADPVESNREVVRARALAPRVSAGEKLMIQWLTGIHQGNPLPAIAAMNDLLAQYPRDIHLAWVAGVWAQQQRQYARSAVYFERALAVDPDFAAALNEVGYSYAGMNQFDKAFAAMERYAKLLPGEPNPEDSYAEMLRMAGRFGDALLHYRAALAIDPTFTGSMLGIADTLALQGKGEEARAQYTKVIELVPPADACGYAQRSALTYVRDKAFVEADAAFRAAAARAHARGLGFCEAESYRLSSMYKKDDRAALDLLAKAETATAEKHEFTPSERDLETALILRQRALRYTALPDAISASAALQALAALAERTQDERIRGIWEGAAGAVLLAQEKFAEAIPHLEADSNDSFSQAHLVLAYLKTGDTEAAQAAGRHLTARYLPTMEDALVVSPFRALSAKCKAGEKNEFCVVFESAEGGASAK